MYRIRSVNRIDKRILIEYPNAKDKIINDMLVNFAHEMFKNKCFEITERNVGDLEWMSSKEVETTIESFVMTPSEFKEAIKTLRLIESILPECAKHHADRLYYLLTETPI